MIPAEFVVDASGKNTRVPEFLDRIGIGAPEVEQDIINCFYSTMQHHVPPERQWQDKVMVICYAYRPFEDTYAAQYYTDSSAPCCPPRWWPTTAIRRPGLPRSFASSPI